MGERMDKDEIVYGDDCLFKFDAGETPKYVYIRFSGLGKCPGDVATPPNDRTFKLTQDEVAPWHWKYNITPWFVFFAYPTATTTVLVLARSAAPFGQLFTKQEDFLVDEGHVFYNAQDECTPTWTAAGGIGVVTWKLEAIGILSALNMRGMSDIFMEMRPLVDGNKVYKFCRLQDATNIAIEYESD